ncbi:hypothetical protein [Brachybacterium paraconglomeratum]|nr:hypothetical protein [Brachybacterium paraconglomeratum]MCT1909539.1 hypothetical protein [Brachybacterium paraconglomeratum]
MPSFLRRASFPALDEGAAEFNREAEGGGEKQRALGIADEGSRWRRAAFE